MKNPLQDLRVLDFTHALAGPYCTMLMAMYGAEVFKVEGLESGDMGRSWGPPFQGGESSYFLGVNTGKKGVAIDLKHPRGLDLCRALVEHVDVLVENLRPGSLQRLGLGYSDCAARNPRLVYCSISGYGQSGPARDEPAMDLILQATSGLISVTGVSEEALARCGHSVADVTAGLAALTGILMALRAREITGKGQHVDVAMLDVMISAMCSNFANYFGSGVIPRPLGTAFATIVPYRTFRTADGELAIAVASEKLWRQFCQAVGKPELAEDERFLTNALRVKNRQLLEPLLAEMFGAKSTAAWKEILHAGGIPCGPVRNLREVSEDPQAAAREMFPVVSHPTAGAVRVTGAPIKLSDTPGRKPEAAPLAGQHTREALKRLLSMEDAEIDEFVAAGIVRESR
ncbi:MAG: CoA transferase [Bryobacteraceae bacterium]|nr:CoA transferase [Bryobacteraceae bacterium]MDW8376727.1 CoA transferase [Bryobacterales bacterium]